MIKEDLEDDSRLDRKINTFFCFISGTVFLDDVSIRDLSSLHPANAYSN